MSQAQSVHGDRVGQKAALIATLADRHLHIPVGCAPSYEQIGIGVRIRVYLVGLFQGDRGRPRVGAAQSTGIGKVEAESRHPTQGKTGSLPTLAGRLARRAARNVITMIHGDESAR